MTGWPQRLARILLRGEAAQLNELWSRGRLSSIGTPTTAGRPNHAGQLEDLSSLHHRWIRARECLRDGSCASLVASI